MREIEVLDAPMASNDVGEKPSLPEVNMAAVRMREERAINRATEDAANINLKVSVHTQAVFDALRKTCAPCPWELVCVKAQR